MGDTVKYNGELWEVGFINQISWGGTMRLQRGNTAYDASVNCIYPEQVKLIKPKCRYLTPNKDCSHANYLWKGVVCGDDCPNEEPQP